MIQQHNSTFLSKILHPQQGKDHSHKVKRGMEKDLGNEEVKGFPKIASTLLKNEEAGWQNCFQSAMI